MTQTQGAMTITEDLPEIVYWHDNQVALTFLSNLPISEGPTKIIQSLHLDRLNAFLNSKGFNLTSFGESDVPHPRPPDEDEDEDEEEEPGETIVQEGMEALGKGIKAIEEGIETLGEKIEELGQTIIDHVKKHDGEDNDDEDQKELNTPVGKYLFGSGSNTFVVSFFNVERTSGDRADATVEVVNLLNDPATKAILEKQDVPNYTSMPNWLNGGAAAKKPTKKGTQGCPVNPPYPVTGPCESGRWKITLQPLIPDSLQVATGTGVRVFILDTLPTVDQIKLAYEGDPARGIPGAGDNNLLLKDLFVNIVSRPPFNALQPAINANYQRLPDKLDLPEPGLPTAGEDIYERIVGFPMVDHGLFIAGIVRDLTPDVQIECIRVLNDEAVGNAATLTSTLLDILRRKEEGKDLFSTPVVINLSLTETPLDEELVKLGFTNTRQSLDDTRAGLVVPLKALSDRGVVFSASAGNDSSPTNLMNISKCRHLPHYPAAFAYYAPNPVSTMIPVGAVDNEGRAASYSHYPGPLGIATYSGKLLKAKEPLSEPHAVTHVQGPIDALVGVFSSSLYPALAKDDKAPDHAPSPVDYPENPAPNANAWAYWMGTSFATPIISAVVARILELRARGVMPTNKGVREEVIEAAGKQQTLWTRLNPDVNGVCSSDECTSEDDCAYGPLIMAFQECQPTLQ